MLSFLNVCGICGSSRDPNGDAVRTMSDALVHRGPDGRGEYLDPQRRLTLGAQRLAIIDIEGGHQPLANEDRTVWAVLNGEIYNHSALMERLSRDGHQFRSRCDTEVLVHLYEDLGAEMVHALEGMFAFAIWDERRGRLLLGRDRFGEKPLFVWEGTGDLVFASELTALRRAIPPCPLRPESVDSFFVFGYLPGPETMLKGVEALQPGHVLEWDAESRLARRRQYWRPPGRTASRGESDQDLQAETIRLLERSLHQTMVSDAPLGIFISGGVDSTLIAALAARMAPGPRPPKTYTVGYDTGDVSELRVARRTAEILGTDHHELVLTSEDVRDRVPSLLADLDQPLADQALVSLHAISEEARRTVKVAVGGQGADELFGGYPRYAWMHRSERLPAEMAVGLRSSATARHTHSPSAWGRREQIATMLSPVTALERHIQWVTKGRINSRFRLYGERLSTIGATEQASGTCRRLLTHADSEIGTAEIMELDRLHWLPDDVLMMSDRAGMLVGLEIRTPYLSRELAEFATTVRVETHIGHTGKRLLRGALREFVPRSLTRRPKVAFRAPGAAWLRGPLYSEILRHVSDGPLVRDGWVEGAVAREWLDLHLTMTRDCSNVLWPLLVLGAWLEGEASAA